jgi:hypothetical protein|nr:MAG TPA: hypothetical protein [Caudoviricetes sp.]
MSHYTVAVITDKLNKIGEMLAPYSENMEVEPYVDETKEAIINSAKERKERVLQRKEKGEELDKYDIEYLNANTDEELYKLQIYEDESYDKNGNHLTTYNPNSKWDWYEIGGRWNKILLVKEEVKDIEEGTPSWGNLDSINKKAPEGFKWVTGAKIKDIEFEKAIEFNNTYNKSIRFWELYVEGQEPQNEEEKEMIKWEIYKKEYYIERYETKENYAKINSIFTTWALLDEKGWHEKGEMGWFAMANDTKDSELLFIEKFTETIQKPENQDKYLVIVDCHI